VEVKLDETFEFKRIVAVLLIFLEQLEVDHGSPRLVN
jgi:hypothetical protein